MTSSQLLKWQKINSIDEFESLGQSSSQQIWVENIALIQFNSIPNHITHLTIRNCALTSIQDISQMKQLVELDLSQNRIKYHVSELGDLKNLKILNVQNNEIFRIDLIEWQDLKELQSLNISNNEILFCEPLKDLDIQELKCDNNKLVDLEFIIKMKNYKFDWIINYSRGNNAQFATLEDFQEYNGPNSGTEQAEELMHSTQSKQDQTNILIDYIQQCNVIKLSNLVNGKSLTLENEKIINIQFTDILNIKKLIVNNCQNLQFLKTPVNITSLTINNCVDIYNIDGIGQMKQLTSLNLNQNSILLIEPVSQLNNLTYFSAKSNYIQDSFTLSPKLQKGVKAQKIPSNDVYQEYLRSINSNISVQKLKDEFYDQKMHSKFKNKIKKNKLNIKSDSELNSLQFMDSLNMHELKIESCKNASFAKRTPTKIKKLVVIGKCNLDGIEKIKQIIYLDLQKNNINKIQMLANLQQLKILFVNQNKISDISIIQKLNQLKFLDLSRNRIESINGIEDLKDLVELYLSQNYIKNIQPLTNLTQLEQLDLRNNKISDYNALKVHPNKRKYKLDKIQ
ncbi:leucine-rich_repeat domain-containing protein [Hexamita inflata]|uniref:Leucine-rich repeat domain-containing protein n=1 Tax=Hexamita inflata TaxID=28002 RepID=A0AA86NA02_9EUKA|nr:leucine-rich repeat domain-containing protein [Hexamita inflata]